MATKQQTKISVENREKLLALGAERDGLSYDDILTIVLDYYIASRADKSNKTDNADSGKLRIFIDAIKKHNASKEGKKQPVYIKSAFWLGKESGLNTHRDVKPVWGILEKELMEHYVDLDITSDCMKSEIMKEKDEKGRLVFITELLKKDGTNGLFNR